MTTTSTPSPRIAQRIIQEVSSHGTPPEEGLQYFSVGLDPYLKVLDDEYLQQYIKDGGATFKLVVGIYGGGKTHFLYSLRDRARAQKYAVAYVSLKSSGESPFYALDLVYKAIATRLLPPTSGDDSEQPPEPGIRTFLKAWHGQRLSECQAQGMSTDRARERIYDDINQIEIPSLSFRNAIRRALQALHNNQQEIFDLICQWLLGEGFDQRALKPYGILQKIDRTTAFQMIRAIGRMVRELGYKGLVVLLDEAERMSSLSTKNREQHLSNLREVIDECGQSSFEGILFAYAVPDQNFLEGRTQVYEALRQRLSTVFTEINPTGVKIMLEQTVSDPVDFLCKLGHKLTDVYQIAKKDCTLDPQQVDETVRLIAEWAADQRYSDEGYKRLFVKTIVQGLNVLRSYNRCPTIDELTKTDQ